MAQRKRGRETFEESTAAGKDHLACDQCRIKKVRCGKERPQCSNCTRVGTECDWSGNGKKPNQTVWLSQSISGLGDRLGQLESVVESVHSLVQRLDPANLPSSAATIPAPTATPAIDTGWLDWAVSETVAPVPQLLPVSAKLADTSHSHVILRGPEDSERCFGPSSLWWLAYNFGDLFRESVGQVGWSDHRVAPEALSVANEKMRQLLCSEQSAAGKPRDGASFTSPPHVILEALIDPYFDAINPYFPIWTRKRFQDLVQKSKQGHNTPNERGFAVCANNLVILTLTAKVLHSRARNRQAAATSHMGSSTDSDLLRTFVRSAHRAFANIEQLLRPTLINIQALLSLCLVAQQHLGEDFCSLALRLTVQVANAMGLHRLGTSPGVQLDEADLQERQNVLYCLTFLDRATCWCHGSLSKLSPCDTAMFNFPSTSQPTANASRSLYARFALSRIQDRIYSSLYSRTAIGQASQAAGVAKETITSLLQDLGQWRIAHGVDLKQCLGDDATGLQTELALLYYQTRTRVLWPVGGRHDGAARMLAEDSWSCVHLFGRLWTWTSEQGHYASLSRHIVSFPPTAVFHLAARLAVQEEQEEDGAAALRKFDEFASSLQVIAGCAEADSYTATFSRFVQVLAGLVADVMASRKGNGWKGGGNSGMDSHGVHSVPQDGLVSSPLVIGIPGGQQQPPDDDLDFMTWISDSITVTPFEGPNLNSYFGSPGLSGDGTKPTLEDLWQEYLV